MGNILDIDEELIYLLADGPLQTMRVWQEMRRANWNISFGATKSALKELVKDGKLKTKRSSGHGRGVEYILSTPLK